MGEIYSMRQIFCGNGDQHRRITREVVDDLTERERIHLICGPQLTGKSTLVRTIGDRLKERGLKPYELSMNYVVGYGRYRRFLTPDELLNRLASQDDLPSIIGARPEDIVLLLSGCLSEFNITNKYSRRLLEEMVKWCQDKGYRKFVVECLSSREGVFFFEYPRHESAIKEGFASLQLKEATAHILKFNLDNLIDGLWNLREAYNLRAQLAPYFPPEMKPSHEYPGYTEPDYSFLDKLEHILKYGVDKGELESLFNEKIGTQIEKEGGSSPERYAL